MRWKLHQTQTDFDLIRKIIILETYSVSRANCYYVKTIFLQKSCLNSFQGLHNDFFNYRYILLSTTVATTVLTSTLVLGINYFVVITRPLHQISDTGSDEEY